MAPSRPFVHATASRPTICTWPRLLIAFASAGLIALQAWHFPALRRGVSALALGSPPVTWASVARKSAVAAPNPRGVCYDNPLLAACRKWRDETLPARRIDIVLVANELFQQFPLTGYGGIETSVENIGWSLHRMGIPFFVVTPGRAAPRPEYPFDVLETEVAPNGRGGLVDSFVEQGLVLLHERADGTGTKLRLVDAAHAAVGSAPAPPQGVNRTLVIWGQSDWSQRFVAAGAHVGAVIASHHDGGGPVPNWDHHIAHVGHRFLSYNQRGQWVRPTDVRNLPRTRIVPHGLPPEDFDICPDGGYFLWVAGLDWGWKEKGLDIFTDLARAHPELKFVAYGMAVKRHDISAALTAISLELKNFEFRGELKRGPEHRRTFCEATAFFMPTHFSIGESFGMTVIESLSKGVPVIASTSGAVPEILDVRGRLGYSAYGAACDTLAEYDAALLKFVHRTPEQSASIQAYAASKFDSHVVVDSLLAFSADVLEWTAKGGNGEGPAVPVMGKPQPKPPQK